VIEEQAGRLEALEIELRNLRGRRLVRWAEQLTRHR
jgi:hypothetical protein